MRCRFRSLLLIAMALALTLPIVFVGPRTSAGASALPELTNITIGSPTGDVCVGAPWTGGGVTFPVTFEIDHDVPIVRISWWFDHAESDTTGFGDYTNIPNTFSTSNSFGEGEDGDWTIVEVQITDANGVSVRLGPDGSPATVLPGDTVFSVPSTTFAPVHDEIQGAFEVVVTSSPHRWHFPDPEPVACGATTGADDPQPSCAAENPPSVWFKMDPDRSGGGDVRWFNSGRGYSLTLVYEELADGTLVEIACSPAGVESAWPVLESGKAYLLRAEFGKPRVEFDGTVALTCNGLEPTIHLWNLGGAKSRTFTGTAGDDVIMGTQANEVIYGGDGNDTICGSRGDDQIFGGPGDDALFGAWSTDWPFGGEGSDILEGGAGCDEIWTEDSQDSVDFGDESGCQPVYCNGEPVTIDMNLNGGDGTGTAGVDVILGTPGDDVISALDGDDTVCAGEGDDMVRGGSGVDWIDGGAGADDLRGGGGGDTIYGGDAGDEIDGQGGADTIYGGAGADVIAGRGAADVIFGDGGDDTIDGHNGVDTIDGGGGEDVIKGQTGADTLTGGSADDDLLGGNGNDTLYGGAGIDKCAGNLGPADAAEVSSCETTPGVETLF